MREEDKGKLVILHMYGNNKVKKVNLCVICWLIMVFLPISLCHITNPSPRQ